ncbi:Uncharacterised protein [Salmonella enterica subsp. enterica serovar Bovismorbificans]|uniref:Uncharacterized protein n=1 Tax=Salmonella enterica subsp. enterica serovar Bovismorbificans TaxID=58097 RepID=A0A655CVY7_SALET|nr:Uncharacterised protein [Salmonella enterica subsp. enterica serovar Bovismorbificans]
MAQLIFRLPSVMSVETSKTSDAPLSMVPVATSKVPLPLPDLPSSPQLALPTLESSQAAVS